MAAAAQDPTQTRDEARPVSLSLGTGIEYDSNVAVLELDTSTDAGDRSLLLDFGVGYDKPDAGRVRLAGRLRFLAVAARRLRLVRRAHPPRLGDASYDLGRVDIGTTLQHAYAELDGNEFLTLQQISPYVSKLVGRRLFLRFAYAHSDKDFAGNPTRSAKADALSADAYVFIDGLRDVFRVRLAPDDENAIDSQFDYARRRRCARSWPSA